MALSSEMEIRTEKNNFDLKKKQSKEEEKVN